MAMETVRTMNGLTGVPIPTIKYYQRQGLLPYGERTGHNQASYADEHVRGLRLVRALVDVAHLPIAAARQVLDARRRAGLPATTNGTGTPRHGIPNTLTSRHQLKETREPRHDWSLRRWSGPAARRVPGRR